MADDPGALAPGRSRDTLVAVVRDGLAHLPPAAVVAVACSGGPDSTALAFLAEDARPDLRLHLVHVGHGLRDDTLDRATVEQHAAWLGAGCLTRDVEVRPDGHGIEAAARDARYAALRDAAADLGAVTILVGHTADDQAETVIMRVARGTGLDGLAAMSPKRADLTRPLLRLRREDVRAFVTREGLPAVEDPTNRDPAVRRALVRHELLPMLGRIAPDPVGAIARLADLARDDAEALDEAAEGLRRSVRVTGPVFALPMDGFDAAPPSLARRVVREILTALTGRAPSADVVARVLTIPTGGGASLPGSIELTVSGGWRALAPRDLPTSEPLPLAPPGAALWCPAGVVVRATEPDTGQEDATATQLGFDLVGAWTPRPPRISPSVVPAGADPDRLWLALPSGVTELTVRGRRPGDRIRTAGGTRRVADVLADAGMPRPVRDVWPLVTVGPSVVWVPGFAGDRELLLAGRAAPAALLVLAPAARDRPGAPGR